MMFSSRLTDAKRIESEDLSAWRLMASKVASSERILWPCTVLSLS